MKHDKDCKCGAVVGLDGCIAATYVAAAEYYEAHPVGQLSAPTPTDPTDERGKVLDVLHAAGINSGGELSASEGVKLLAERARLVGIGRFVPDEPKPTCAHGYGHGGVWCGPHVECWLDPRPKSERGQ